MSEGEECESLVVVLDGTAREVPYEAGYTIVEAAWRAGLHPPISCLSGNCATCIARVEEGTVAMRRNEVLSEEEQAAGYALTCQGYPSARVVRVAYDA